MKGNYELQHRVALLNPYGSVVRTFDADPDAILVGIKNIHSIPNTLMHRLEPHGFALHTIDKKSQLAGRAVDTQLINPITGHFMSGSSSGTAINVFAGINDLGIGNDGGGSVLAPAMCVNILGFISRRIEGDRENAGSKPNTDGMIAGNSIGFMARDKGLLYRAIRCATGLAPAEEYGYVISDREYPGVRSQVRSLMDSHAPRGELTAYLGELLKTCDVLMLTEGPVDLHGFGDSLFGHFDERTRVIQAQAEKGYVRVANIASATALALPQEGLGMSTLLLCEDNEEKIGKLLKLGLTVQEAQDPLIERYFLDLNNYFMEGYEV
ncbi:MAG: hypothetical protein K2F83_07240 [Oscillospiraceae bacterium]|nr:hypothetical protein [Oscillospiraceae bacterium]